jgi:hypothetical protein
MNTPVSLATLPAHLRQRALTILAALFCKHLGTASLSQMQAAGFEVGELLDKGWIRRSPGRFATGFTPGDEVIREMWNTNPHLCAVLALPRHVKPSVPETE